MKLIGFAGPIGAGKTTAAKFIEDALPMSFASPLKQAVKTMFALEDYQINTLDGKNTVDERWGVTPRELLTWIGTDVARARYPDIWVRIFQLRLEKLVQLLGNDVIVTVDDVRFEDEAEAIRQLGGIIVHIRGRVADSPEHLRTHKSENGITIRGVDMVIPNSYDLKHLKKKVNDICQSYQGC